MIDHDARVSRRYAELAREEPGTAIDGAILAASKRALVRESWSRRWGAPVSIAAVLFLAVGVTLRMQYDQPGIEQPDAPRPAAAPPPSEPTSTPDQQPAAKIPAPAPELLSRARRESPAQALDRTDSAPAQRKAAAPPIKQKLESYAEPKPFSDANAPRAREEGVAPADKKDMAANVGASAGAPAAQPAPAAPPSPPAPAYSAMAPPTAAARAPAPAAAEAQRAQPATVTSMGSLAMREKRDMAQAAPLRMQAAPARTEEEVELERIAKLRVEGKHEEADKALVEFRRKHPEYRIPEATWERVRPR